MIGKYTDEWKKKNSERMMGNKYKNGRILSAQSVRRLSDSHKGIKQSEESKRKNSEAHKGEKCHFWRGGISFVPYTTDWTWTLRMSIRERDKYICQMCGEKQGDITHSVHHVDYDKKNCNPENLITLCTSCHIKTNVKREYWLEYFRSCS